MGPKYKFLFLFIIVFASFYLFGCASEPTYLVNLSFVKGALINYQESGQFDKEAETAVNEAINAVEVSP